MSEAYGLDDYVADLRRITAETDDESEIMKQVRPLAARVTETPDWLTDEIYQPNEEQGFAVRVLHEEADHSLAVLAVSWLPGSGAESHDHGTWAVVAGCDGDERNVFYSRLDDRSKPGYAEIREAGHKVFGPGEVLCMKSGAIHAVYNDTGKITVSLHTYGKHPNFTDRVQYDITAKTATAFQFAVE